MSSRGLLAAVLLACALPAVASEDPPYLRINDQEVVLAPGPGIGADGVTPGAGASVPLALTFVPRAWHGQPVPGGGVLFPAAGGWPFSIKTAGRIAFYAKVLGSPRNQGIFVVDAQGLRAIAVGCGGGGGSGQPGLCGDPSPIGGSFSGFYQGSLFAPDLNDAGDVLFLAEVVNGASRQGLFLYRAATDDIVKVAAVGDSPPAAGGRFDSLGPGSLNNSGQVVFLASTPGSEVPRGNAYLWSGGVVSKVAATGDSTPAGVLTRVVREGFIFLDGVFIPVGPVPDISNSGQVAFQGMTSGSGVINFASTNGVHTVYARTGDVSPAGGVYTDLWAPIINDAGEMAFLAHHDSPGLLRSGWFVGRPGAWRHGLSHYDPFYPGQVWGIAVSRNPHQPLDNAGNLLVWADIKMPEGDLHEILLISFADGSRGILAREGDPSPLGGELGDMQPFCSMTLCQGELSAYLRDAGGVFSGHMTFDRKPGEAVGVTAIAQGERFEMSWDPTSGSNGSVATYDVARGSLAALHAGGYPASAVCAANSLGHPLYSETAGCEAPLGDGCWYLVRARDACGPATFGPPSFDAASPCE